MKKNWWDKKAQRHQPQPKKLPVPDPTRLKENEHRAFMEGDRIVISNTGNYRIIIEGNESRVIPDQTIISIR